MVGTVVALLLATFLAGEPAPAGPSLTATKNVDSQLEAQIEAALEGMDGTYGVAVENLQNGRMVLVNADQSFPTASLYKLLVMYRVYEKVREGSLSMDDVLVVTDEDASAALSDGDYPEGYTLTVGEALESMITVSSNVAAYALVRALGGWGEVDAAISELGISAPCVDEEYLMTPTDVLGFFVRLIDGSLVDRDASDQMISLLLRQKVNDRLPALLPEGTLVAHKTGELDDVRNDGGIVFAPGSVYAIVLMGRDVAPEDAVPVEAEISRLVYNWWGS